MMHVLLIATLMLAPVAAPPSAPLQPTGKWSVNYAQNMCAISHDFGDLANPTSIAIAPLPLGEQSDVIFFAPGAGRSARGGKAVMTFDPLGQAFAADFAPIQMTKDKRSGARFRVKADGAAALKDATTITVTVAGSSVRLSLPPVKPVLTALRTCQDDLLKGWGVDPREGDIKANRKAVDLTVMAQLVSSGGSTKDLARAVVGTDPAGWITPDDYPVEALAGEKQGTALLLWTVGADGRVQDCRILATSGDASLDRASCQAIAKRARYTPGTDQSGKPTSFHATGRVSWRLPR